MAERQIQADRVAPWFAAQGDKTHRLNYNLTQDSVVFDLGGYEGRWASEIFCRYGCYMHIFEVMPEYAANIRNKFLQNPKVKVYPFGLGANTGVVPLYMQDDSSSTFKTGSGKIDISLVEAADFLQKHGIERVHLMKINIEGGEYDLLEHLLDAGYVNRIENLQVQFHDFLVDNAYPRMKAIQQRLAQTHELTYYYEFVWENWRVKPPARE